MLRYGEALPGYREGFARTVLRQTRPPLDVTKRWPPYTIAVQGR